MVIEILSFECNKVNTDGGWLWGRHRHRVLLNTDSSEMHTHSMEVGWAWASPLHWLFCQCDFVITRASAQSQSMLFHSYGD